MRKVPFMDSTGLNNLRNLWKRSKKEKITLILSGVTEDVRQYLNQSGFSSEIGDNNIFSHISDALDRAKSLVRNG